LVEQLRGGATRNPVAHKQKNEKIPPDPPGSDWRYVIEDLALLVGLGHITVTALVRLR
jgi:hypothetical protein